MHLRKVRLELEAHEVQQLLAIDLDDDRAGALEFVRKILVKRIEKALQRH